MDSCRSNVNRRDKHQRNNNNDEDDDVSVLNDGKLGIGGRLGVGGRVDGVRMSDRVFKSSFELIAYPNTKYEQSDDNNNMTTTENDDHDQARRATHAGHGEDRRKASPLEAATNQEAGASSVVMSVPAHGLVSMQSPNDPARPVLTGQVTIVADFQCERMGGTRIHFLKRLAGGQCPATHTAPTGCSGHRKPFGFFHSRHDARDRDPRQNPRPECQDIYT